MAPPAALSWALLLRWCRQLRTQGRVHQDGVVELGGGLGDVHRLHLLEAAQRVALGHQLGDGALVEGSSDQQDHVIDHVAVPAGWGGAEYVLCVTTTISFFKKI